MSNDHRANTTNTPSIKIEARPARAVPDKNDKLMQAKLNREVDATLNQAKILLDSEPDKITARKPADSHSENRNRFDPHKYNSQSKNTSDNKFQNRNPQQNTQTFTKDIKKENPKSAEIPNDKTERKNKGPSEEHNSNPQENKENKSVANTQLTELQKKEEPLHMNDEKTQQIVPATEYDRLLPQVSSLKSRVNLLTFALILVIGAAGYGAYYLDKQKYSDIMEIQHQVQQTSSNVTATEGKINDLYNQIKAKDERVTNLLKANDELKNQNNILKSQQETLQKTIDKANKQTEAVNIRLNDYMDRNPNDWLVAKSYFLVSNAQNILSFSDNIEGVLLNLSQADMLLVKIDEPAVNQIREAISKDILSLKKVEHVDSKGILYKLDSVYNNVDNMPLNEFLTEAQNKAAYQKAKGTTDSVSDWKENLLTSLKEFSSRFIEVRRRNDGVVNQYLSPEQSAILLQNIKTEILLAKIALFNKDQESFAHNLDEIKKHISAYYDINNADVTANLEIIDEISNNNIASAKPDQLSSVPLFNAHAQTRFNLYKNQKKADKPVSKTSAATDKKESESAAPQVKKEGN
ncbi:uroporphyrinogen-III C-methyltransferase [Succinivibrio dextrinosolvens]|uniref:uroporphyrinogen-III C-methyltransferase n=1 Tax=Succinivibrio dextrinosolvens TaxID=83771 RepID=UPI002478D0B4|nr:uroporphyrinogen-III C-methyltransferase [Succinivibrio dextrinosolvens]